MRIQYKDQSDFERIAHQFGVFEEWKVKYLCDMWDIFLIYLPWKMPGVFGDNSREMPALSYLVSLADT